MEPVAPRMKSRRGMCDAWVSRSSRPLELTRHRHPMDARPARVCARGRRRASAASVELVSTRMDVTRSQGAWMQQGVLTVRCGFQRANRLDHRRHFGCREHLDDRPDRRRGFGCDLRCGFAGDLRCGFDLDRHCDFPVVRLSSKAKQWCWKARGCFHLDSCCDHVHRGDVGDDGGLRLHRDHHPSYSLGTRRTNHSTCRRSSHPSARRPNPHQIQRRSNHLSLRRHQNRWLRASPRHQCSSHDRLHRVRRDRGRDDVDDAFVGRHPRQIRPRNPPTLSPLRVQLLARQLPPHQMVACQTPCGSRRPARQSTSTGGP